ncbi:SGNH/GDSL hydrolase family protein [Sphingobacterium sp. LRF_L2]|uniref:SGNH/GDSL hydrolase family protein n=1 Tax=Sphingobacterium sp. LRF_L2 TaxID=3369421 RepID=UPI003F5ED378
MGKIITILVLAWSCQCSCFSQVRQSKDLPANTSGIAYVGRTVVNDLGEVTFDWVGSYFEFTLKGQSMSIRASDKGESHFNVFVDGLFYKTFAVSSRDTLIDIVSNLEDDKQHLVRVQKRSEGEFGCTTIHHFTLGDKTKLDIPSPRPGRFIEFIGDSFTVGYGADGTDRDQPFSVSTENADKTYACILARYFQTDYALIAHSGRGAARNYGDSLTTSRYTMKDAMLNSLNSDTTSRYGFDQYIPDLVVINLGSNDFSTAPVPSQKEFQQAYLRIIRQLRRAYGAEVKILCVVSRLEVPVGGYIADIVGKLDDNNLYYTASLRGVMNNDSDMGAAWHPGVRGHQKMATFLVPYIATVMDWSMEDRVIK